jgi:hypothetical protein
VGEAVILPKDRDPRFVTVRRGGTLQDSDRRLLAEWAADCAEHVLPLFKAVQPADVRPRQAIERARAWVCRFCPGFARLRGRGRDPRWRRRAGAPVSQLQLVRESPYMIRGSPESIRFRHSGHGSPRRGPRGCATIDGQCSDQGDRTDALARHGSEASVLSVLPLHPHTPRLPWRVAPPRPDAVVLSS